MTTQTNMLAIAMEWLEECNDDAQTVFGDYAEECQQAPEECAMELLMGEGMEEEARRLALAVHLDVGFGDVAHEYDNTFSSGAEEWLVLSEEEAEELWEESLDNYLDECILPELPEMAQVYFDSEAWKRDARIDGRGHSLAAYDGCEEDSLGWCLFRTN